MSILIETVEQYRERLNELECLIGQAKKGTLEGDRLNLLLDALGAYEEQYYPLCPKCSSNFMELVHGWMTCPTCKHTDVI